MWTTMYHIILITINEHVYKINKYRYINKISSPNFKTRKQFWEVSLPSELHFNKNFLVFSQVIRNYSLLRNVALCRIAAL